VQAQRRELCGSCDAAYLQEFTPSHPVDSHTSFDAILCLSAKDAQLKEQKAIHSSGAVSKDRPSILSETGLDFVTNATLTRAIVLQIITGLEIFPVTSCNVGPHRLPGKLEDCGHRISGYALHNRLCEPEE